MSEERAHRPYVDLMRENEELRENLRMARAALTSIAEYGRCWWCYDNDQEHAGHCCEGISRAALVNTAGNEK